VLFHRQLRCLVVIELKFGKFTHAVAGQMHLYMNSTREHWMMTGENSPVGLTLCAEKDHAVGEVRARRLAEQGDGCRVPEFNPANRGMAP
jgi:YhcG PDDEXK nuclease domain